MSGSKADRMDGGGDTTQPNVACLPAHIAESIPTLPEVEELTEEEVWHTQAPVRAPGTSMHGSARGGPLSEHNDENASLDGSDFGAQRPISIPGASAAAERGKLEAAADMNVQHQKRRKNSLSQMSFDGSQRSVDMDSAGCTSDVSREDDGHLDENRNLKGDGPRVVSEKMSNRGAGDHASSRVRSSSEMTPPQMNLGHKVRRRLSNPVSVPTPPSDTPYKVSGTIYGRSLGTIADEDGHQFIPPHIMSASAREHDSGFGVGVDNMACSASVVVGSGRTLKGRDATKVRNAIFKQTGFL